MSYSDKLFCQMATWTPKNNYVIIRASILMYIGEFIIILNQKLV